MKKNKYTALERQMRSKLGENQDAESWNTPDDALFFSALEQVDELNEKRSEPSVIYLSGILIFTLLILLIGQVYIFPSQNSVNQFVSNENLDADVQNLSNISITDFGLDRSDNVETERDFIPSTELDSKQSLEINNIPLYKTSSSNNYISGNAGEINNIADYTPTKAIKSKSILDNVITSSFEKVEVVQLINKDREKIATSILAKQSSDFIITNREDFLDLSLKDNSDKNLSKFRLYAGVGVNYSCFEMPNPLSVELFDYTNWSSGSYAELGLNHTISNRFRLLYSLGYKAFSNNSRFSNNMAYDSNNEFINIAGEKAYNCEFDIVTPTTRSSLDLNLLMNHDMEDDEMMRGVIDIEQEYQTISLGIMPQYDFIRQSRITIGAGLALNANYITSFNQTMDIKLFHNSYIMTRKSMNDNQGNGLNRFYVSASINSYIEYQWNQRFSTGVNASLGRSLNSLSQYTITHMKDINIGITSQYRF